MSLVRKPKWGSRSWNPVLGTYLLRRIMVWWWVACTCQAGGASGIYLKFIISPRIARVKCYKGIILDSVRLGRDFILQSITR
ncbi:hypothetical protein HDV57DRAFT_216109 [Trichoderma longibrachiatum]